MEKFVFWILVVEIMAISIAIAVNIVPANARAMVVIVNVIAIITAIGWKAQMLQKHWSEDTDALK